MDPDTYLENVLAQLKDAEARIEQLEKALKSCAAVIKAQRAAVSQFSAVASDALIEADKALTL